MIVVGIWSMSDRYSKRWDGPMRTSATWAARLDFFYGGCGTSMADDLISVMDVAAEYGKSKATIFKILKRLRIESKKLRRSSSGNQLVRISLKMNSSA